VRGWQLRVIFLSRYSPAPALEQLGQAWQELGNLGDALETIVAGLIAGEIVLGSQLIEALESAAAALGGGIGL
jgi:hypothetical protein